MIRSLLGFQGPKQGGFRNRMVFVGSGQRGPFSSRKLIKKHLVLDKVLSREPIIVGFRTRVS